MSEVKRYINCVIGMTGVEMVRATDYAKLSAEAQALREEVAQQKFLTKVENDALKMMTDKANELKSEVEQLEEELESLRARVVVLPEPVTMDGTTTIREYVANAVPKDTPMDKWTQGYEECKRRIHAMFEQPCNKRLNGKTVSEGLLRRISDLFPADMGDDGSGRAGWFPHVRETVAELRALLNEDKENGNG
ncbi:hypothetical protein [Pseudomonas aeruginosa]|uniref:hypothetical protein n=2 Tax=Pseudomonas aeruginosa TaxID=287 RepID=UPI00201DDE1C|nr:hypothetical protein [Pseudomonas aeruginosa]MCM1999043.1 hypothetical protein [Pseudomonas aeruginosa]MCM2011600.1 hypothetical protein [Pseudomonas aeruginosa]MCM2018735.1 hypothetical protein [Pseudomonas aeruginosa]MCM2025167.1 hypothetical protein [Pseudomonas aeruginosa]MCM2031574.1 hypothetical protein [Pseudomonas aeruginosa]